ncbi:MAG: ATP-dependent helicase [Myxococcaceae bacterium]
MDLIALNAPQREAVTHTQGPLLVLAGAGSGKTRVITHRIAYLLGQGAQPSAVAAVTFTNKAASEMKERLVRLAGKRAEGVRVSTFHALGADMLREDIARLGWPKRFAIADMGDQLALVRRALRERQIDDRTFDARRVLMRISRAKNQGAVPAQLPEGEGDDYDLAAHFAYPIYQQGLRAQGAVDFDDLLALPLQLVSDHEEVRSKYQRRFSHWLVDEFQDTNAAQLRLLHLLAGPAKNVCAVGDDDQSIYSWRGAELRNVLDFEKHFPGSRHIKLEENYRSTASILNAANAVISKNVSRMHKRMWTAQPLGARVQVVAAPNEVEEARWVAMRIASLLAQGISPDDIAILYRTNGQSGPFEEALLERRVPYAVVGGNEFFDRREVRDVMAYLKLLAHPGDELSLLRIINVPARGIGDVTVERLRAHAADRGMPLSALLSSASQVSELPPGAGERVEAFGATLSRYRQRIRNEGLAGPVRAFLVEIGYGDAVREHTRSSEVAARRLASIDALLDSLARFEQRSPSRADLMAYLNRLSLDSREEEDKASQEAVSLMTLHAVKGLEFQAVFLVGAEEDCLPHAGMQGEAQNLEEERRLCYVGVTRAREQLFITRSKTRLRRGKEIPRTPSRFLEDLPAEGIEINDLDAAPKGPPTQAERNFFQDLKARLAGGGQTPPKVGSAA